MARMSPADRRAAIVDATLQVMLRKGLAGTTVRDIAEQLDCSSGLVHHYFESMDDLLAEAFAQAAAADLASARAAAERGGDPIDRLRRFIASYSRADEDWSFQLWLDAWSEAVRRPAVGRTSRRLNEQWHSLLVELITAARDASLLVCADPVTTAWTLLSLLDGLALQAVAHPGTIDRRSVIAWTSAIAERELGLPAESLLAS
jgi:AcrR family transcriptional regulator